jgi:hypothetical protein
MLEILSGSGGEGVPGAIGPADLGANPGSGFDDGLATDRIGVDHFAGVGNGAGIFTQGGAGAQQDDRGQKEDVRGL